MSVFKTAINDANEKSRGSYFEIGNDEYCYIPYKIFKNSIITVKKI